MPERLLAILYRRSDQDSVEADLAAFFGPRAHSYLRTYRSCRDRALAGRRGTFFWSWPAFWSWFIWFAWRKLYWEAAAVLALTLAAGQLAGDPGSIAAYLLACLAATPLYLRRAAHVLDRAGGLAGEARGDFIARAGGVSWAVAAAGLVALLATCAAWAEWRLPALLAQLDAWGLLPPQ